MAGCCTHHQKLFFAFRSRHKKRQNSCFAGEGPIYTYMGDSVPTLEKLEESMVCLCVLNGFRYVNCDSLKYHLGSAVA